MAFGSPGVKDALSVVWGDASEQLNAPDASQNEVGDNDSGPQPEPDTESESFYVSVLDTAIYAVLEHEAHLFTDGEIACVLQYNELELDSKFLYARFSARRPGRLIRESGMENWKSKISDSFLPSLGELCGDKTLFISDNKPQRKRVVLTEFSEPGPSRLPPDKRPLRAHSPEVINLISDEESDEDDELKDDNEDAPQVKAEAEPVILPPQPPAVTQEDGADYSYILRAVTVDSPEWDWAEMLELLKVEELKAMCKMLKISAAKAKPGLIDAIIAHVDPKKGKKLRQTTLDGAGAVLRYRKWVMDKLGICVRFNKHIHDLMCRIDIIYLRCTQLPDGFLTPPILDRAELRNYMPVEHQRTPDIWKTRDNFMDYYRALHVEADIDWLMNTRDAPSGRFTNVLMKYKGKGAKADLQTTADTNDAVWYMVKHHALPQWRSLVDAYNHNLPPRTTGLERFEAGYVYTRLVHKGADALGPMKRYDAELELLEELLKQGYWRSGRRGAWHERRALILEQHVDDKKELEKRRLALQAVVEALDDPHTHFIHRASLDKRARRLVKALKKLGEHAEYESGLVEYDEIPEAFVEATQVPAVDFATDRLGCPIRGGDISKFFPVQKTNAAGKGKARADALLATPRGITPSAAQPARADSASANANTGRTRWRGRDGEPVTVEQVVLERYEGLGYKGRHCEGGTLRTLFGILFWDVIFAPVPGAFETAFQQAPLDLSCDTFVTARAEAIEARKQEIAGGIAVDIFDRVDEEHRKKRTMCVGVNWDLDRDELREALECFEGPVLAVICTLMCEDYVKRKSGLPDLFLWHPEERSVRFSEVKSPNDHLQKHQKVWLDALLSAGADAEVCNVRDPAIYVKEEKGKKGKKPKVKNEVKTEVKAERSPVKRKRKRGNDDSFDEEDDVAPTQRKRPPRKSAAYVRDEDEDS